MDEVRFRINPHRPEPSVPGHELALKEGVQVISIKNLGFHEVVNGANLFILKISRYIVFL